MDPTGRSRSRQKHGKKSSSRDRPGLMLTGLLVEAELERRTTAMSEVVFEDAPGICMLLGSRSFFIDAGRIWLGVVYSLRGPTHF